MHTKDGVIMGPIKNQLREVQSLGDVAGLSKASWVQSSWAPSRAGTEIYGGRERHQLFRVPKGRRRNGWSELRLGVGGNLLHTDPPLQPGHFPGLTSGGS